MEADLKIGYINVKSYKTSELQVCFHLYVTYRMSMSNDFTPKKIHLKTLALTRVKK